MERVLTEKEAEIFLEKEGFSIAKREIIKNSGEIKEIEKKIPYPWVMKASSKKIVHKNKMGAVIMNIDSSIKARESFDKLSNIANFEEAMIQETLNGEEIILGIKKTPEFGQVIMFGKGGKKAEEEKDISFRVLPINNNDIESLINETQIYKTLIEKQANLKILKKIIIQVSNLAKKHPGIIELDINPLFLNSSEGKVADARIIESNEL